MTAEHDRLRMARTAAGYENASDAARAMGIPEPTYLAHENGSNGLSRAAKRYAEFFRISLDWLLTGKGEMRGQRRAIPLAGSVGPGGTVGTLQTDGGRRAYADAELVNVEALQVIGDSQYPRYLDGEFILVEKEPQSLEQLINKFCMVETEDGRRLIKVLRRSERPGTFLLWSHNAPEEHAKVRRAFRVRGSLTR